MYYCMYVIWVIILYIFVVINYYGRCVCVMVNVYINYVFNNMWIYIIFINVVLSEKNIKIII